MKCDGVIREFNQLSLDIIIILTPKHILVPTPSPCSELF